MDKSGALVTPLKSLKLQLPSRSFLCQPGAHGVHQGFGANALLTNLLKMFEGGICGNLFRKVEVDEFGSDQKYEVLAELERVQRHKFVHHKRNPKSTASRAQPRQP